MKNQFFSALVLAISLSSVPVPAAPQQPDEPTAGEAVPDGGYYPQGALPSNQQVAPTLVLPAGTLITVRVTELLSSDRNQPGDGFTAVLEQPLVADGWVVSQRGQTAIGRVDVARKAGRTQGMSQLAVELSELILVDGQQLPIRTQLLQSSGGTSRGHDAEAIGAATGIGAILGAAAGGGQGSAIGAAAGAAAGLAGVLATRGRPTEIVPEAALTFRLEVPLTIFTQRGRPAFRLVTQEDYYDRGTLGRLPQHHRATREWYAAPVYPPPPPYYSPYYYPAPGYIPFYGGYRLGPRFYISPRPRIYVFPRSRWHGRDHYRHR